MYAIGTSNRSAARLAITSKAGSGGVRDIWYCSRRRSLSCSSETICRLSRIGFASSPVSKRSRRWYQNQTASATTSRATATVSEKTMLPVNLASVGNNLLALVNGWRTCSKFSFPICSTSCFCPSPSTAILALSFSRMMLANHLEKPSKGSSAASPQAKFVIVPPNILPSAWVQEHLNSVCLKPVAGHRREAYRWRGEFSDEDRWQLLN